MHSPNTNQLTIDGHVLTIPTDPVESVRFIRAKTLASYRSVVAGASTARDQALVFGAAISESTDGRREATVGPPVHEGGAFTTSHGSNHGTKAAHHPPSQPITAADPSSTATPSQRHPAPQPPSPHRGPATLGKWIRRRTWQTGDGFIGDFQNPLDVRTKTHMSANWAKGRYIDGAISFRGVFAKTQVMERKCGACEQEGERAGDCTVLVDGGKEDAYVVPTRRCGRCVARDRGCKWGLAE